MPEKSTQNTTTDAELATTTATSVKKKKGKTYTLKEFLNQRRSYILGILIGLVLIIINTYVGLYMIDILLDQQEIPVMPGISLPAIRVGDYEKVRDTYLSRQQKILPPPPEKDPYQTSL